MWSELEYEHESKVVESIKENNFCIERFFLFFCGIRRKDELKMHRQTAIVP
jgi:hypothetical protein